MLRKENLQTDNKDSKTEQKLRVLEKLSRKSKIEEIVVLHRAEEIQRMKILNKEIKRISLK
jgi:hypothetical protein